MRVNKKIKPTQKQQAFYKTCCKLKKHSLYIKLRASLTTLKIGESLLTANPPNLSDVQFGELPLTTNSPTLGFWYNSDS